MNRKVFIAVIGGAKSGKTTIVRSLTGCSFGWPKKGDFVIDRVDGRKIFVIDKSPQESSLSEKGFKKALGRCAREASAVGMVVAMQPTEPTSRLSMEEIFEAVSAHRFSPLALVLDPGYNGQTNGRSTKEIRRRLNRFGVVVKRLDGRHFAHLNARRIRKIARIP
jgi:hypothetical protein